MNKRTQFSATTQFFRETQPEIGQKLNFSRFLAKAPTISFNHLLHKNVILSHHRRNSMIFRRTQPNLAKNSTKFGKKTQFFSQKTQFLPKFAVMRRQKTHKKKACHNVIHANVKVIPTSTSITNC